MIKDFTSEVALQYVQLYYANEYLHDEMDCGKKKMCGVKGYRKKISQQAMEQAIR